MLPKLAVVHFFLPDGLLLVSMPACPGPCVLCCDKYNIDCAAQQPGSRTSINASHARPSKALLLSLTSVLLFEDDSQVLQCVVVVVLQGTGMVGVPGIASSLFSAVRDSNVNVIMISQASSEHSICFAVKQYDADTTLQCLHERQAQSP